ncbi:hypothetical protein ABZT17_20425 [Streptomyces sp. NPDC005648]|uniref:hypothetical protein n=1 Tax=Streptomyces sp. NPDC005648 TaxID=3157044 RepID=UPI0033BCE199
MRNRTWIASAGATVALLVASGLYVQALETGHGEDGGGLRVDPGRVPSVVAPLATRHECAGHRPVGSLPAVDDGSPLERVLAHIDKLAQRERYATVFTGLSIDEDRQIANVWRVPSDAFDADVCGSAVKGVTVRLYSTDVDRKTLDALSDRIADDMRRWDGTFQMRQVGVDERGFVLVGVDHPDKARPIIEKAYGKADSGYIKVVYVDQAEALAG